MKELSVGKYRALQKASTRDGIFCIVAIDHQDALRRAINPDTPTKVTDDELIDFKLDVLKALKSQITGVLLDPLYGLPKAIERNLAPNIGLLVELEKADYHMNPLPLDVEIDPDWSVSKIKRLGADGVKLFFYYNPDNEEHSENQDTVVRQIAEECTIQDIPFYAEPIIYQPYTSKREAVVESARRTAQNGADILKLEFPVNVQQEQDERNWFEACQEITSSITTPWVLLSAGVDFETFTRQLKIACQAGASGFIVGRALWGDVTSIKSPDERIHWLKTRGRKRLHLLNAIANLYGRSWHTCSISPELDTHWFRQYQEAKNA